MAFRTSGKCSSPGFQRAISNSGRMDCAGAWTTGFMWRRAGTMASTRHPPWSVPPATRARSRWGVAISAFIRTPGWWSHRVVRRNSGGTGTTGGAGSVRRTPGRSGTTFCRTITCGAIRTSLRRTVGCSCLVHSTRRSTRQVSCRSAITASSSRATIPRPAAG